MNIIERENIPTANAENRKPQVQPAGTTNPGADKSNQPAAVVQAEECKGKVMRFYFS